MSTLFTKIINGELPGRFIWRDEDVVAFLSIAPLSLGHTLVVPRQEVDKWTDASGELLNRVMNVAQIIGQAQVKAFESARAGLVVAGFEVNHLHVHVWPANSMDEFNFSTVQNNPDPEDMDEAAQKLRRALHDAGYEKNATA